MNDIFSYDWKSIGERIKNEREKKGMSQSNFAEYCGLQRTSRGTVGEWEKGKRLPDLEALLKMCELFECELGYILCEEGYECKTRAKTDIQEKTGLTAEAISSLCLYGYAEKFDEVSDINICARQRLDLFSAFITSTEIAGLLDIYPTTISKIEHNGLNFSEEQVFSDKDRALKFYEFEATEIIMRFLGRYFKSLSS